MMTFKKRMMSLMLTMMFLVSASVGAQQQQQMLQQQQQTQKSYSDEEIDVFANALVEALPVQQEAEKKMVKEIEDQGMGLEQFNQLARQMQQQGGQPEGVSQEDMKTFQSISSEIQSIQMETQKKVNDIITEEGITPAKYQEMIGAYQQNPNVKQKVDQKLAQSQQQ